MDRLEKIKKKYVGKWIALSDEKVIAASPDFHELHKTLKQKNVKDIFVVKSPTKEEKKYGFLLLKCILKKEK